MMMMMMSVEIMTMNAQLEKFKFVTYILPLPLPPLLKTFPWEGTVKDRNLTIFLILAMVREMSD